MRRIATLFFAFCLSPIWAQTVKPTVASTPATTAAPAPTAPTAPATLGTSDQVAIKTLEDVKANAQKAWENAQQTEITIAKEFAAAHPGYIFNLQTLQVEKIAAVKK